jgi:3-dehydrotetronate 4-kinase
VAHFLAQGGAAYQLDPLAWPSDTPPADIAAQVVNWATAHMASSSVLVYSTADTEHVKSVQAQRGTQHSDEHTEQVLAQVAQGLVQHGVSQLVVAGGETSGACVQALGISQLAIGAQIDPGVPWCYAPSRFAPLGGLHIALKSGNFGSADFFTKAFQALHQAAHP